MCGNGSVYSPRAARTQNAKSVYVGMLMKQELCGDRSPCFAGYSAGHPGSNPSVNSTILGRDAPRQSYLPALSTTEFPPPVAQMVLQLD